MSRLKDAMIEREGQIALAKDYLVSKKMLSKCDLHGEIYGGGYWKIEEDFWKVAMADRNRGSNGPVPWAKDMQAREYTDILKEAYDNTTGDGCGYCAKLMNE